MNDVLGQAVWDYYNDEPLGRLWIHNKYGPKEEMRIATYFRKSVEMPELELVALDNCRGKILEIGSGPGSHAIELQRRFMDVTALEISEKAAEVMKLRGVEKIVRDNIFAFRQNGFDTVLLLMNGIGLVGTIQGLIQFFQLAKKLLNPNGQLIFDSSDVAYLYDQNFPFPKHYYGQISYRYEYKKQKSEWFTWLYVDQRTLTETALQQGWQTEILFIDEHDQYLARLRQIR